MVSDNDFDDSDKNSASGGDEVSYGTVEFQNSDWELQASGKCF
jgi:hypothetical protein